MLSRRTDEALSSQLEIGRKRRSSVFTALLMDRLEVTSRVNMLRQEVLADISEINEYRKSDGYLLRWLIAHNDNVECAKTAILESSEWRELNKVDNISNGLDPVQSFPLSIFGVDNFGRPITYVSAGDWDWSGQTGGDRIMIQCLETIEKSIRTQDQNSRNLINQSVLIIDMHGVTTQFFRPNCMKQIIDLMNLYENYYPEMVCATYLINVPRYFKYWMKLIRPFMNKTTSGRIKVFDRNSNAWRDALLQIIKPICLVDILRRCQKN